MKKSSAKPEKCCRHEIRSPSEEIEEGRNVSSEEEFGERGRRVALEEWLPKVYGLLEGIEISRDPNLRKANKKVNFNLGQLAEKSRDQSRKLFMPHFSAREEKNCRCERQFP